MDGYRYILGARLRLEYGLTSMELYEAIVKGLPYHDTQGRRYVAGKEWKKQSLTNSDKFLNSLDYLSYLKTDVINAFGQQPPELAGAWERYVASKDESNGGCQSNSKETSPQENKESAVCDKESKRTQGKDVLDKYGLTYFELGLTMICGLPGYNKLGELVQPKTIDGADAIIKFVSDYRSKFNRYPSPNEFQEYLTSAESLLKPETNFLQSTLPDLWFKNDDLEKCFGEISKPEEKETASSPTPISHGRHEESFDSDSVATSLSIDNKGKKINKKKRSYTRGAITQEQAAALCGVSPRLVCDWDKGIGRPEGYPGRSDGLVFRAWVETYKGRQRLTQTVIGMSRATPTDPTILDDM